jgi:hypothetical protein
MGTKYGLIICCLLHVLKNSKKGYKARSKIVVKHMYGACDFQEDEDWQACSIGV